MGQRITYQTDVVINKGDEVTIEVSGFSATGKVLSADHYGDGGWYIEMRDRDGTYRYYKQQYDGGKVTHVNGKEV